MTQQSTVINFTRGVPANESFPDRRGHRRRRSASLQAHGRGDAAVRAVAGLPAAARVARRMAGRQRRPGAHRQRLAAADRVPLPAPAQAGRRRVHRVARPTTGRSRCCAATARRSSASRSRPTARTSRRSRRRWRTQRAEVLLRHPGLPEPGRRHLLRRRSAAASPSSPSSTASCSSRTRPTGCCAIAAREEPTLYELAPERTLHMSSFTKLIAPGVRTGFMLGEPALIAKLAKVAEDTYISPGYVAQGITYEWCRRGLLAAADRAAEGALRAAARRLPRRRSTRTCPTRWRRGPTAASSSR